MRCACGTEVTRKSGYPQEDGSLKCRDCHEKEVSRDTRLDSDWQYQDISQDYRDGNGRSRRHVVGRRRMIKRFRDE